MAGVLIVDDHPLIARALQRLIEYKLKLEVVGHATTQEDALRLFKETQPDLMTVDLHLASGHGLPLIEEVRALSKRVRILVITAMDPRLYAHRALELGASGYVAKCEPGEVNEQAIKAMLNGELYLSPHVLSHVVQHVRGKPSGLGKLSNKELQAFEALGQNLSTREIATLMDVTLSTAETTIRRVRTKLELSSLQNARYVATVWVHTGQLPELMSE